MRTTLYLYQLPNGNNVIKVASGKNMTRIVLTPDETQKFSNILQSFAKSQKSETYTIDKDQ